MTPWERYKEKLGTTRPWDLLLSDAPRASEAVEDQRMGICGGCPELIKVTKQCKQCGCFMVAKTKLLHAKCPLGKW